VTYGRESRLAEASHLCVYFSAHERKKFTRELNIAPYRSSLGRPRFEFRLCRFEGVGGFDG
jgi:hypothetical protein